MKLANIIEIYINKNYWQQRIKLIAWYEPTYENPHGFSIRFVFAKLVA